jgi:hypothetical protein
MPAGTYGTVVKRCAIHRLVEQIIAPRTSRVLRTIGLRSRYRFWISKLALLMKLVRRREIWLPTLWAWLLLLIALAFATLIVGRALYPFLALTAPSGGKILAIEGWMDPYGLDQAVTAFRNGGYELLVTTGAPMERWPRGNVYETAAERAAEYLKSRGLPPSAVAEAPTPASAQDRTFLAAVMVREWAKRSGIEVHAIDVFSMGAHTRRSRYLYQKAFGPEVKVGAVAARHEYADERWWRSAEGAREVLDQAIAYAWVVLFFRPPPPDSHEERSALPPKR